MSPVATVTRDQYRYGVRSVRVLPHPFPPLEVVAGPVKEIVVDWQMPAESDRKS